MREPQHIWLQLPKTGHSLPMVNISQEETHYMSKGWKNINKIYPLILFTETKIAFPISQCFFLLEFLFQEICPATSKHTSESFRYHEKLFQCQIICFFSNKKFPAIWCKMFCSCVLTDYTYILTKNNYNCDSIFLTEAKPWCFVGVPKSVRYSCNLVC